MAHRGQTMMLSDFPEIKASPKDFTHNYFYVRKENTVYLGFRENGKTEELIEAALNHELMHWILHWFINEETSKALDCCLYGLNPSEFRFISKVQHKRER